MTTPTGAGTPDVPERTRTTTTAGEDTGTAKQAAGTATEEAGRVAGVAKGQAREVASEIGTQARDLVGELKTQVHDQSISQRDRLADNLRRFGDDLDQMGQSATGSGLATDLTGMLATKAREVSTFLGEHEPSDLIEELRQFARRRPGLFLLGAAVAGVVAGRLTRGAASSGAMSSNGAAGRHRMAAEWSTTQPSNSRPLQGSTIASGSAELRSDEPLLGDEVRRP